MNVTGLTQKDLVIADDDGNDPENGPPPFQPGQLVDFFHHGSYKAFEQVRLIPDPSGQVSKVSYCFTPDERKRIKYVEVYLGLEESSYPPFLLYLGWFPLSEEAKSITVHTHLPVFLHESVLITSAPWFVNKHFRVYSPVSP